MWGTFLLCFSVVIVVQPSHSFNFSNTLGDNCIMATPVRVWGYGEPGATVITTVTGSKSYKTSVGNDGLWRQTMADIVEGPNPIIITSKSETNTIVLNNVLVGKVVLCSGQSNVELVSTSRAFNSSEEVAACDGDAYDNVRIARVLDNNAWNGPLVDLPKLQQPWARPNSSNCGTFSATCLFVARDLAAALEGKVAVGVIQSAVGGTAVRNWVPEQELAACSQPWPGLEPYGYHPYTQSTLYNGMISPFGTGPTSFTTVVWDQAESDSYPQTPPGYYGCQTLAHINGWRRVFQTPMLPWVFVHLQPYTGSEGKPTPLQEACADLLVADPLAELRHAQLSALQLPATGYASAIDLGDPTSPYGNVHFQNKQVISKRIVSAIMVKTFNKAGPISYPPPTFLKQVPAKNACEMTVSFFGSSASLMLSETADPGSNGSSAVCPEAANNTCKSFELFCTTPESPHNQSNPAMWVDAAATVNNDNTITLTPKNKVDDNLVARGSRYAWTQWPLAILFSKNENGNFKNDYDSVGLPVLPWNQALTCTGGAIPGAIC
eukprot:m.65148 g.65148  ORF g.65148 m.65148 type:complete len:549 (-) comp11710_c0_seq2:227-1873(-)